jgi:hypothetical protein
LYSRGTTDFLGPKNNFLE